MADGRIPDGDATDEALRRALRRAAEEARPRPEFRERLREGFLEGSLVPAVPDAAPAPEAAPAPAPAGRVLPIPRWLAYPAAAAALLVGLSVASSLRPEAPFDPPVASPPALSPAEEAMVAAERRLVADPVLGGRTWQRRLVGERPWLFPAEAASADAAEVEVISRAMADADATLRRLLEGAPERAALPVVAVVAPTRSAFEAHAAPLIEPLPLSEYTIAFGLRGPRVLLIAPETLAPGGPPCEEMDIVHEAAHAWLHARMDGAAPLPLWLEEGLADGVSMRGMDAREWCRKLIGALRGAGLDPFSAKQVLETEGIAGAAEVARQAAPCDERPYSLLPAFHAHAQSLVMFLLDEEGGRRERFLGWFGRTLAGERADADGTARALGFENADALIEARDAWLGL